MNNLKNNIAELLKQRHGFINELIWYKQFINQDNADKKDLKDTSNDEKEFELLSSEIRELEHQIALVNSKLNKLRLRILETHEDE